MLFFARVRLALVIALAAVVVAPAVAGAERYRRDFSWSGYRWQVRLAHNENPGHNDWGDSPANVRVRPDGTLRFAVTRAGARRRSVEIATKRILGYGRYRWIVGSRLGRLDDYNVLALFTNDTVFRGPYGEQIFEFSHWGQPLGLPGWGVSWSAGVKSFDGFPLSDAAPYTAVITWRPSQVRLFLRDGAGAVLYDATRPVAGTGRFMAARMSYWLSPGSAPSYLPPPMVIRSFHFTPLARLPR